jgi:hypothetical protein
MRVTEQAWDVSVRLHEEILTGVSDDTVRDTADALRQVLAIVGRRRVH